MACSEMFVFKMLKTQTLRNDHTHPSTVLTGESET